MRTYYGLVLSVLCALGAWVGPVLFLEDRWRASYLAGGLGAALLSWAFLAAAVSLQGRLHEGLLAIMGAGAAVLSWAPIALVAFFDVLPHIADEGLARFDPVWLFGGFAPVMVGGICLWRAVRHRLPLQEALTSALFRFSVPLFGLELFTQTLSLPKQFRWLFLFTGVLYLVLDTLSAGAGLSLLLRPADKAQS